MRSLNHIEQAFTYSNEVNPLCVVIVLRLRRGPSSTRWRKSLDELQRRHVLLRCSISVTRKGAAFRALDPDTRLPLRTIERESSTYWEQVTEEELNTRFDASGPLIRTVHLVDETHESEFILVLHHAIMDGISARLLLHELLRLSTGLSLPPPLPETDQTAEHVFPKAYRGLRLILRLIPFVGRNVRGEWAFSRRGVKKPAAASSYNRVLHLCFPADISRRVNVRIGREGLSPNSVINAALLLAVRRKLYRLESQTFMRAISFADLRESLDPPPNESVLGCMISMLRVNVVVEQDDDVLEVARRIRREIFGAAKMGEPFIMSVLAKSMTGLVLRLGLNRIATSAVSFLGKLELEPQYNSVDLVDVHAFITNNIVGPELSCFGKILFGRLELDFTYLASELSEATALELLHEVEVSLLNLAP